MAKNIIVLVEDNPDDELLIVRELRNQNFDNEIKVLRDGEEALSYLWCEGKYAGRNIQEQPEVVFLDIILPKMSGIEVLRKLRQNEITRCLPVVMLTSSREEKDIVQSYLNGANSFIRKPIDFIEFRESVRRLGNYWVDLNEKPEPLRGKQWVNQ